MKPRLALTLAEAKALADDPSVLDPGSGPFAYVWNPTLEMYILETPEETT